MNKIDNSAALPDYLGPNRKAEHMKNEAIKQKIPTESFDKLALSNRASISMKIVFQSVSSQISAKFEKLDFSSNENNTTPIKSLSNNILVQEPLSETDSKIGIFDYEEVARTVMDFVGGSILAAKANGASDDELKEMFEQGKAGANLGIDQAIGDLKELALLNDDLSQGIEKSRELINKNIDDLYEQIFPKDKESNSKVELESPNSKKTAIDSQLYASHSKSSDLTITTTDGDVVSISFSELQEYANNERHEYKEDNKGLSKHYSSTSSQYHEINFSYSVEGELDNEEKIAIEELIKNVNSLQKDFFSGNVDKAFEKAIELGFDNEQISNFSMDLQQTKTSYVSQAYAEVAELDQKALPSSEKELRPLIDFLDHFRQLQQKADELLSKDGDAFGKLIDAVFKAEFGEEQEAKEKFDKVIEIVKTGIQNN